MTENIVKIFRCSSSRTWWLWIIIWLWSSLPL